MLDSGFKYIDDSGKRLKVVKQIQRELKKNMLALQAQNVEGGVFLLDMDYDNTGGPPQDPKDRDFIGTSLGTYLFTDYCAKTTLNPFSKLAEYYNVGFGNLDEHERHLLMKDPHLYLPLVAARASNNVAQVRSMVGFSLENKAALVTKRTYTNPDVILKSFEVLNWPDGVPKKVSCLNLKQCAEVMLRMPLIFMRKKKEKTTQEVEHSPGDEDTAAEGTAEDPPLCLNVSTLRLLDILESVWSAEWLFKAEAASLMSSFVSNKHEWVCSGILRIFIKAIVEYQQQTSNEPLSVALFDNDIYSRIMLRTSEHLKCTSNCRTPAADGGCGCIINVDEECEDESRRLRSIARSNIITSSYNLCDCPSRYVFIDHVNNNHWMVIFFERVSSYCRDGSTVDLFKTWYYCSLNGSYNKEHLNVYKTGVKIIHKNEVEFESRNATCLTDGKQKDSFNCGFFSILAAFELATEGKVQVESSDAAELRAFFSRKIMEYKDTWEDMAKKPYMAEESDGDELEVLSEKRSVKRVRFCE